MMTLYLTFEGLEQGKLTLDQRFTVSRARRRARRRPSSTCEPGETVTLHDLIFAIVTHSANDAAVVARPRTSPAASRPSPSA